MYKLLTYKFIFHTSHMFSSNYLVVHYKVCSLCILFLKIYFQLEVLEMLVHAGADLNAKNKHDETPAGKINYSILFNLINYRNRYTFEVLHIHIYCI